MRYGSVCSGIEAATAAWHQLGWTPAFFSEIEAFPSAVLAHRYGSNMPGEPLSKNGIPNHGDFTKIGADAGPVDLLVGGTPCQSFSVAGKRLGLDDPRGNLALEYLALARRLCATWFVWENVPGVLSSVTDEEDGEGGFRPGLDGREAGDEWIEESDFATFLSFVRECGYGFAYRVLDAQFVRVDGFGRAVPQRRRRVFVVGYLGDWRRAAAVLLEPQGMRGDPAPRREPGKRVAPTIASRPTGGGGLGTAFDLDGGLISTGPCAKQQVRATIVTADGKRFIGENDCENAQPVCPRADMPSGVGYHLCRDVCRQTAHAEINALRKAGSAARGAVLFLEGHSYACDPCKIACAEAGISRIEIAPPPEVYAFGGGNTSGPLEVSTALTALTALTAHGRRQDFEVETFIAQIASTLPAGGNTTGGNRQPGMGAETAASMLVAHTLLGKANSSHDHTLDTYIAFDCKASGQAGFGVGDVAPTLRAMGHLNGNQNAGGQIAVAHTLKGEGFDASEDGTGRGTPIVPVPPFTLAVRGRGDSHQLEYRQDGTANAVLTPNGGRAGIGVGAVAYGLRPDAARSGEATSPSMDAAGKLRVRDAGFNVCEEFSPTLDASAAPTVAQEWAVRRLTPTECERLQGFPDDFTNVPWGRKDTSPDGPRYKALGNSMAVNVMRWIGHRIDLMQKLIDEGRV